VLLLLLPHAGRQMIYELEEMFPGPGLNLLLGPNGSGTKHTHTERTALPSFGLSLSLSADFVAFARVLQANQL
jgi:hypothetical protein